MQDRGPAAYAAELIGTFLLVLFIVLILSVNSAGGIGEFSANSRSLARSASSFSSISFFPLASSNFSEVRNFSYKRMGSRASQ